MRPHSRIDMRDRDKHTVHGACLHHHFRQTSGERRENARVPVAAGQAAGRP